MGPVSAPDRAAAARAAAAEWERGVAALRPDEQVLAVAARLEELNRGFDGVVRHHAVDGSVTYLEFSCEYVSDLSPVRALRNLKNLNCSGPQPNRGRVTDVRSRQNDTLPALATSTGSASVLASVTRDLFGARPILA